MCKNDVVAPDVELNFEETKAPTYICPKHGDVSTMFLSLAIVCESDREKELKQLYGHLMGNFCLFCYAEMINKNCKRLKVIEDGC